jgi:hypothetical protein
LYYREELTMKEIAEVVGVALSRISQIRQASMKKLRVSLAHLRERPMIPNAREKHSTKARNLKGIEELMKTPSQPSSKKMPDQTATVHACNFRSAGRLSNENARSLTAIHETFARQLASALDVYLGTALDVKLQALDQLPLKEHVAAIPPLELHRAVFSQHDAGSCHRGVRCWPRISYD